MAKSGERGGERGCDGFLVDPSSPDHRWQKLFSDFLKPLPRPLHGRRIKFAEEPSIKAILATSHGEQIEAIEALIRRRLALQREFEKVHRRGPDESDCFYLLGKLTVFLLSRNRPYTPAQAASLISLYLSGRSRRFVLDDAPALLKICQKLPADAAVSSELREAIKKLATLLHPASDGDDFEGASDRRTREDFQALL
jgi:hypothetical protein